MCAKATAAASSFSISGLLDSQSKTRERYPVVEIEIDTIQDHPNNTIYSMDETEIERLAESINHDGLTDLPLVRKLPDGQWQMLSGHRRKAAFTMLSINDHRYDKMPCRVLIPLAMRRRSRCCTPRTSSRDSFPSPSALRQAGHWA